MKRIDRLILSDLFGPWVFGVAMFTLLIMAATYLNSLTDFIVQGVPPLVICEMTLLYLPGVMVKTFPMAVLLATLLGFGRLSGDSEIVALRASGVTVFRMMRPVLLFSFGIALISLAVDETFVPPAAVKAEAIKSDVARTLNVKSVNPVTQALFSKDGFLEEQVLARDFNLGARTLRGVTVIVYDRQKPQPKGFLFAKELSFDIDQFKLNKTGWKLRGGATYLAYDGSTRLNLSGDAWPESLAPAPANMTPQDLFAGKSNNMDNFSMTQLGANIKKLKGGGIASPEQIRNMEFQYWNKLAIPLAAIIYGLLGGPLGIRNHRAGTATGFALSIAIIFGYIMLTNLLNVYAMGGVLPPYVASLAPITFGLFCALFIMWRRNV